MHKKKDDLLTLIYKYDKINTINSVAVPAVTIYIIRSRPMNYWNKEIECAPRSEIEALQSYRLSRTIRRVYENVAPYRKKMDEAGV